MRSCILVVFNFIIIKMSIDHFNLGRGGFCFMGTLENRSWNWAWFSSRKEFLDFIWGSLISTRFWLFRCTMFKIEGFSSGRFSWMFRNGFDEVFGLL